MEICLVFQEYKQECCTQLRARAVSILCWLEYTACLNSPASFVWNVNICIKNIKYVLVCIFSDSNF